MKIEEIKQYTYRNKPENWCPDTIIEFLLAEIEKRNQLIETLEPIPKWLSSEYEELSGFFNRGGEAHKLWQEIRLKKHPGDY